MKPKPCPITPPEIEGRVLFRGDNKWDKVGGYFKLPPSEYSIIDTI
jgi:hypothetical protein